MPTTPPSRGLSRRLLGSPLLEALAAPHGVDRYLELIRPSWSLHATRAEVVDVRRQTSDSVTLTLRPNENWQGFSTGQFVRLTVEIDGVRHTRCYSPACSEHAAGGALELTVSTHPEGKVSRYLRDHARPGMVVGLTPADGDFVLPDARPEHLLLISGGSGITPVMSMLRTLCDEGLPGRDRLPQLRALATRALRRRARSARGPPRERPRRPRLHAWTRPAAHRALPPRAPARRHLRALQRRDVRLRSAGADRVGAQDLGRRRHRAAAPPSRPSRRPP